MYFLIFSVFFIFLQGCMRMDINYGPIPECEKCYQRTLENPQMD